MQRLPTHLQITLACVGVMCCVTPCFADLSDGLIAEYLFEGNANDTSGNAFHATAAGPTLTTGRNGDPNSAYLFDDFLEVIQIPDAVLDARTDFSFCVSLNFTITPPDNVPAILSGANASFTNEIVLVRSDASPDDLTVALHDASYIATVLAPGEAEPNTWTSFAWVRDVSGSTSTSTIYVDGVVRDVRTNSFDGALSIGLDGLYLGNDQDVLADAFTPANQFHGVMDNAYFYNRPLSEIEIRNLHGIPAPSALLAGLGLVGALAARRHRKT